MLVVGVGARVGASWRERWTGVFPTRVLVPPGVGDAIAHVAAATARLVMGRVCLVVLHDERWVVLGDRFRRLGLFGRHVDFAHDLVQN